CFYMVLDVCFYFLTSLSFLTRRSEHRDLHSFPTRRSSDLAAQRVARQALEHRPRGAERGPDEEGHQRPRQPSAVDDELGQRIRWVAEQRAHHVEHADAVVADGQRGQEDDDDGDGQGRAHGHDPAVEPERPPVVATTGGVARGGQIERLDPEVLSSRSGVAARGDVGTHRLTVRRRRTKAIRPGPPMIVVTMPTCSSPVDSTTRPTMSDTSIRIGATTRQNGRIQRWSGPVNARTRCGTIKPTKPMGPTAAVAA